MENNNFSIKCYLIILSIESSDLKHYILLNNDNSLPSFYVNRDIINNLEKYANEAAANLVFADSIELMPQLINFNSPNISNKDDNELNIVYGFIIDYTKNIHDNVIWQEFSYAKPDKYSDIIFEVSQKLR